MKDDTFLLQSGEAEKEIRGRAIYEPIIYNYLTLCERGELTYRQALEGMVIHLSNAKNNLFNEVVKLNQTSNKKLFFKE